MRQIRIKRDSCGNKKEVHKIFVMHESCQKKLHIVKLKTANRQKVAGVRPVVNFS